MNACSGAARLHAGEQKEATQLWFSQDCTVRGERTRSLQNKRKFSRTLAKLEYRKLNHHTFPHAQQQTLALSGVQYHTCGIKSSKMSCP
jgi:hypothetical protein